MANLIIVAAVVLGLFLAFVAAIWLFQERIAFQPERAPFPPDAGIPRIAYTASDGQRLFAYIIGDPVTARGLLIAFHGNADLAVRLVPWANEIVQRTGMAVMIVEYRGYMGLEGKPTYEGSRMDADAAYRYATESLRIPSSHISFFGHSLGSAIAAELAARHRPASLVLQSPFTSARDMSKVVIGRQPANFTWTLISRLHFDTDARVALLDAPVSVSHGSDDLLIPTEMGRRVFDAAKVKGEWLLVAGASHNDVQMLGGEAYWQWITAALVR